MQVPVQFILKPVLNCNMIKWKKSRCCPVPCISWPGCKSKRCMMCGKSHLVRVRKARTGWVENDRTEVKSQTLRVMLRSSHCWERLPLQSLNVGTILSSSEGMSKHWLLFTCSRVSRWREKMKKQNKNRQLQLM